jgi:N-carbamoylputrescine amidase
MKAAVVAMKIEKPYVKNIEKVVRFIGRASEEGADLVLFPEACLTGLINKDDPEHDRELGITVPGETMDILCRAAERGHINVALGILEREGNSLYDSALFINREGKIALKYRRMSKGWHGRNADSNFYREGTEIGIYESDVGKVGFLICGDLFTDDIAKMAGELKMDYLLFPFARCFADAQCNQEKWDREEQKEYAERVKLTRTTTIMANYLGNIEDDDTSFGGAFVISGDGEVIASYPLDNEGILFCNI